MANITYKTRAFSRDGEMHEVTAKAFGAIEFKDGNIHFSSMGHKYTVAVENVVRIETEE